MLFKKYCVTPTFEENSSDKKQKKKEQEVFHVG